MFTEVPHSLGIKFYVKHDREVAQPVRPILELGPDFVQKWGSESAKMIVAQFLRRNQIRLSRKSVYQSVRLNWENLFSTVLKFWEK